MPCLMMATIDSKLQKQHENIDVFDMLRHLKKLYKGQVCHERYDVSKALFGCKLAEGSPIRLHMLKMIGYVESLERLGALFGQELATNLILQSLPTSYNQYVMNYSMNESDKFLLELLSKLRIVEQNLNMAKPMDTMMIRKSKKKQKGKGKTRKPKPASKALKPKGDVGKEAKCFHCDETKHWKRNCKIYLEDQKKKGNETSTSVNI
ncbi:hypothetical protein L6164_012222 [Bauhinia variegata]|uniref:Uncharacterized protein n=1 Tax=Bauhinia variegata TaxID=167791 RepID=A0ACB9PAW6_BAUVA|nr:hypothetical protein L6164_012222 [Bauhinia variegata]